MLAQKGKTLGVVRTGYGFVIENSPEREHGEEFQLSASCLDRKRENLGKKLKVRETESESKNRKS